MAPGRGPPRGLVQGAVGALSVALLAGLAGLALSETTPTPAPGERE